MERLLPCPGWKWWLNVPSRSDGQYIWLSWRSPGEEVVEEEEDCCSCWRASALSPTDTKRDGRRAAPHCRFQTPPAPRDSEHCHPRRWAKSKPASTAPHCPPATPGRPLLTGPRPPPHHCQGRPRRPSRLSGCNFDTDTGHRPRPPPRERNEAPLGLRGRSRSPQPLFTSSRVLVSATRGDLTTELRDSASYRQTEALVFHRLTHKHPLPRLFMLQLYITFGVLD